MYKKYRREFLKTLSVVVGFGLSGCLSGDSGDNGNSDEGEADGDESNNHNGSDSSTIESGNGEMSGRQITGEVNNDLSGFEVLEHSVYVSEDSLSGSVTLSNVGNETASLFDHQIDIQVFDAEGSVLGSVGSWSGDKRELGPGEEGVMEFSPRSAFDADFSLIESYEVVLTCSIADPGVYCP